jgi:hypothetical protein
MGESEQLCKPRANMKKFYLRGRALPANYMLAFSLGWNQWVGARVVKGGRL